MKNKIEIAHVAIDDIELTVEYMYFPPSRGSRDSFMGRAGAGPQLEPDEPASIEIGKVSVGSDDQDISSMLTDKHITEIEEQIEAHISSGYDDEN